MTSGFDGAIVTQPMPVTSGSSNTSSKVVPLLVVFQRPP